MPDTVPTRPLGAQISHMLKARGVDVIFGIPGVHNIELYRGIEEAGITHVLARHEQGAGFMADGYARASGKPGVVYLITGPGLCNALTPLGQAYSDSVPVLAISSCLDEVAARRGQLHQMRDQQGAGATVCDWSETALSSDAAFRLVDRAFAEFTSSRPRPKHIQVPISVLGDTAAPAPAPGGPPGMPQTGDDELARIVSALRAAERPIFIFGGGARGGSAAIPALLRQTGAAAFTTYAGRGLVPADHPLGLGAGLSQPESAEVLSQADLVVAVGTELAEVDLWRARLGHAGRMIRVDIDPANLTGMRAGDMAICGDAGTLLGALSRTLAARSEDRDRGWSAPRLAWIRARWRAGKVAAKPAIAPVIDALSEVMPEAAMIYSDMTQFAYLAKDIWDMKRPGHWHHPFGFGTLGYALPAAIGGAMARPGLPTVCIAGDYGFQYTVQELGTAVELGLPLPILLWDNGKLKEIEDAMIRSQIAPNAVVAKNPDFLKLAAAYGAAAAEPDSLAALQAELDRALAAGGPTLIRMTPALAA